MYQQRTRSVGQAPRKPTKKQLRYIRQLRKELGRSRTELPDTRRKASNEINRLLIATGRKAKPPPRVRRRPQDAVKVSIARDLAQQRLKLEVQTEQSDLKAQAEARRAAIR